MIPYNWLTSASSILFMDMSWERGEKTNGIYLEHLYVIQFSLIKLQWLQIKIKITREFQ